MAVRSCRDKHGNLRYEVYVNITSKITPTLRRQKRIKGFKTRAAAMRAESELRKKLTREIAILEGRGLTWLQVVNRWADEKRQNKDFDSGCSEATVQEYLRNCYIHTQPWHRVQASTLTRSDGRELIRRLESACYTRGFQKKVKTVINSIYNWGVDEGLIKGNDHSPVAGIKLQKKVVKIPEILREDEILKLLDEASRQNHPWFPIWHFALLTGLRNGELYALRKSKVDLEAGKILIDESYNFTTQEFKSTKSGDWRTIPMSDGFKSVVSELMETSNSEFLLPRLKEWTGRRQSTVLRSFCKSIGITSVKFHTLRACFATQLLEKGVEPAKVMKICGWKQLKTLEIYMRLAGISESGATDNLNIFLRRGNFYEK